MRCCKCGEEYPDNFEECPVCETKNIVIDEKEYLESKKKFENDKKRREDIYTAMKTLALIVGGLLVCLFVSFMVHILVQSGAFSSYTKASVAIGTLLVIVYICFHVGSNDVRFTTSDGKDLFDVLSEKERKKKNH